MQLFEETSKAATFWKDNLHNLTYIIFTFQLVYAKLIKHLYHFVKHDANFRYIKSFMQISLGDNLEKKTRKIPHLLK